jgi:glyoxylase I family protein
VITPSLHHVLIATRNLERSRQFYREVLELQEIVRPNLRYPGAWFEFWNGQQIHIVVRHDATFREDKPLDSFDVHFAVRVKSFNETVESLRAKGFREDASAGEFRRMILRPNSIAGNPQIYVLDPDRNIVEFNCEALT